VIKKTYQVSKKLKDGLSDIGSKLQEINDLIKDEFPTGRKLVWSIGPYKNRGCVVHETILSTHRNIAAIGIIVRTPRLKGIGFSGEEEFIDTNTDWHRTAYPPESFYSEDKE
jgi:hypothetical protein